MIRKDMAVALTPEQEKRLRSPISRGDFLQSKEAARRLIDERIAEHDPEENGKG